VIVDPPVTAAIATAVGDPLVVAVNVVETRFVPMLDVESAAIFAAVLYKAAPEPTKNMIVYEPLASGVKLSV